MKWINGNNTYDFFITDVSPNFLVVPKYVFFKKSFNNYLSNIRLAIGSFLVSKIYEIWIQKHIYNATLYYLDIRFI